MLDTWELDEDLRHAERILGMQGNGPMKADSTDPETPPTILRIDEQPREVRHFELSRFRDAAETFQAQSLLPLLTWVATLLGTMTLICGGLLLVWSTLASRPELWRIGQPIALGGVAALVVGLVMQLDQRWQDKRGAAVEHSESDSSDPAPSTIPPSFDGLAEKAA